MGEKSFFKTKVGHQTLAGFITIGSFPLLYYGQLNGNRGIMFIGLTFVVGGMLSSPIIKYLHNGTGMKKKTMKENT
ncbi:hypothetical protein [Natronincola ferrireducens]|uniref:Uncharacterized protein n=1 Tax=Natronincola ferrireducens TaxID=393762 RepID=A0A1G9G139_9FIRM|nr:hypothetical protein [Natronincola ferrireducens]SDK94295.1 hypothetical protein SAMN05660472_02315 [Natronincola ferrireducens]